MSEKDINPNDAEECPECGYGLVLNEKLTTCYCCDCNINRDEYKGCGNINFCYRDEVTDE